MSALPSGADPARYIIGPLMTGEVAAPDDEDFLIDDDVVEVDDLDPAVALPPWCLLVVDDEPGVHAITQLALRNLEFKGRRLEILNAYSGAEALAILRQRRDIAVILLDVVMETDDAGLRCVRTIREELGNREVRIILRTGQPGQAPEQRVVLDYDINDYKAKTELTSQRLFTAMIAALRTYDHIMTIEASRRGLSMVIDASSSLFMVRSLEQLHSGVLIQLQAMIGVGEDGILCVQRGAPQADGRRDPDRIVVLAASGRFRDVVNQPLDARIPQETAAQIQQTFRTRQPIFGERLTTLYISTPGGREVVASFDSQRPICPHDRQMIELFAAKVSLGFENLCRFNQLRAANGAATALIAQMTECRTRDAGRRALHVARLADAIARKLAGSGVQAEALDGVLLDLLSMACVVDAGREVAGECLISAPLPEETLYPAGDAGWFDLGAQIADYRGERWDGNGGRKGLSGEDIPLAARIVAVAERFDLLSQAESPASAIARIREEAGTVFDPAVVDAFLSVVDGHMAWRASVGG